MRQRHRCRLCIAVTVFCIIIFSDFCPLDFVTHLVSSFLPHHKHPSSSKPHLLPHRGEKGDDQGEGLQRQQELFERFQHDNFANTDVDRQLQNNNIAVDAAAVDVNHRNDNDERQMQPSTNSSRRRRRRRGKSQSKHVFISVVPQGGLGNAMFQYAALLCIAHRANLTPTLPEDSVLRSIFNLTTLPLPPSSHPQPAAAVADDDNDDQADGGDSNGNALSSFAYRERWPCAYDDEVESLGNRFYSDDVVGVTLHGYFQSWRYFDKCRSRIHDEFTFLPSVKNAALSFIREAMRGAFSSETVTWRPRTNRIKANNNNNNNNTITIVGIHVRRGDMRTKHNVGRGYTTATPSYLHTAMRLFEKEAAVTHGGLTRSKSGSSGSRSRSATYILYIVCSDDIAWSRAHIGYGTEGRKVKVKVKVSEDSNNQGVKEEVKNNDVTSDIKGKAKRSVATSDDTVVNNVKVKEEEGDYNKAPNVKAIDDGDVVDGSNRGSRAADGGGVVIKTAVVYSEANSDAMDLAILAQCDHVIGTVGTFSWWAGWLAGGTVTYYASFPRPHSPLAGQFNADDYWPANWIGLS